MRLSLTQTTTRAAAKWVVAFLALVALVCCLDAPTLDERIAQRIVVTKFDPVANFTSFGTFATADSVLVLTSFDPATAQPEPLDPAVAQPILREVAAQLSSRGYREVARTESPDLGVAVTVLNVLRGESVAYGSWWSIGPASPSFWGFSTATIVAPFSYQTVAWQSGTMVIELDDLRAAREATAVPLQRLSTAQVAQAPSDGSVRVVWAAVVHGVIGAAGATIETPPIDSIRQAFAQSPYLRR